MTYATKAIYRWLLSDYIKVSNVAVDELLYTENDLDNTMNRIETVKFHEEKSVNGIKVRFSNFYILQGGAITYSL